MITQQRMRVAFN